MLRWKNEPCWQISVEALSKTLSEVVKARYLVWRSRLDLHNPHAGRGKSNRVLDEWQTRTASASEATLVDMRMAPPQSAMHLSHSSCGHRRFTGIHVIFPYFLVDEAYMKLSLFLLGSVFVNSRWLKSGIPSPMCNILPILNHCLQLDWTPLGPLHSKSRSDIQNVQLTEWLTDCPSATRKPLLSFLPQPIVRNCKSRDTCWEKSSCISDSYFIAIYGLVAPNMSVKHIISFQHVSAYAGEEAGTSV